MACSLYYSKQIAYLLVAFVKCRNKKRTAICKDKKVSKQIRICLHEYNFFTCFNERDVPVEIKSPDPDDDFIFALAVSNNAKAIVCGEKFF
jgi:hypothetical protein